MDVHQRVSGALMAAVGGCGLLFGLFLGLFGGLLTGRWRFDMSTSVLGWVLMFLVGAYLLWCAAALFGGLAAALGRAGARRWVLPAAFPILILFPFGSLVGAYTLWSYWRKSAARPLPAWKRIAQQQQAC